MASRSALLAALALACLVGATVAQMDRPPVLGSSCSSVPPDSQPACCEAKAMGEDAFCDMSRSGMQVGTSCGSQGPANLAACCAGKTPGTDASCPTPRGASCATVSPSGRKACCDAKAVGADSFCDKSFPKATGTSCGTVSPTGRKACCEAKAEGADAWCTKNLPKSFKQLAALAALPCGGAGEARPGGNAASLPKEVTDAGCLAAATAAAAAKFKVPTLGCSPKELAAATVYTGSGPVCKQVVAGLIYTFNFKVKCGPATVETKFFQAACFVPLPYTKKGPSIIKITHGTPPPPSNN